MERLEAVLSRFELDEGELSLWIERRWVRPAREDDGWLFDEVDVARLELICELKRDLDVGEEALPVILSLVDQVYALRRRLRVLAAAIEDLPEPAREDLARRLKGGAEEKE